MHFFFLAYSMICSSGGSLRVLSGPARGLQKGRDKTDREGVLQGAECLNALAQAGRLGAHVRARFHSTSRALTCFQGGAEMASGCPIFNYVCPRGFTAHQPKTGLMPRGRVSLEF